MDEKMKELSQVLPSEIEARSFEIITEELGERTFPEKEAPIVKRFTRQPTLSTQIRLYFHRAQSIRRWKP